MKTTLEALRAKYEARSLTAFGPVTERKVNRLKIQTGSDSLPEEITSDEGELRFNDDLTDPIEPNSPAYGSARHVATILAFGEKIVAVIGDRE